MSHRYLLFGVLSRVLCHLSYSRMESVNYHKEIIFRSIYILGTLQFRFFILYVFGPLLLIHKF